MITIGNGIYEYCDDCGKLVKLNKWLFGSLHVCNGMRSARRALVANERKWRVKRESNRAVLMTALTELGLTDGTPDDEYCSLDECGVRIDDWCLCYGELDSDEPDRCGVYVTGDLGGDAVICAGLPSAGTLAKGLRPALQQLGFLKAP